MSTDPGDPLYGSVRNSWRLFLETYEPLRPELFRYCRYLTRSPWNAEDLTQETMYRAFSSLGIMEEVPRNPKAWLFRIASNHWLNQVRRSREIPTLFGVETREPTTEEDTGAYATREAAGTLMTYLSPRERAAVVLKDAFGMPLQEIAEALSTTTGAIKSALHRGRLKLEAPEPAEAPPVVPAVLNAFCDAFNARDLNRLTALLLDTATFEYPGFKIEYGAKAVTTGSLHGILFGCPEGGYDPIAAPRCDLHTYRGVPVFLWWVGDEVHAVVRAEADGNRISSLHSYYHSPEVIAEVCRELEVPFRTHGYHPDTKSP